MSSDLEVFGRLSVVEKYRHHLPHPPRSIAMAAVSIPFVRGMWAVAFDFAVASERAGRCGGVEGFEVGEQGEEAADTMPIHACVF